MMTPLDRLNRNLHDVAYRIVRKVIQHEIQHRNLYGDRVPQEKKEDTVTARIDVIKADDINPTFSLRAEDYVKPKTSTEKTPPQTGTVWSRSDRPEPRTVVAVTPDYVSLAPSKNGTKVTRVTMRQFHSRYRPVKADEAIESVGATLANVLNALLRK